MLHERIQLTEELLGALVVSLWLDGSVHSSKSITNMSDGHIPFLSGTEVGATPCQLRTHCKISSIKLRHLAIRNHIVQMSSYRACPCLPAFAEASIYMYIFLHSQSSPGSWEPDQSYHVKILASRDRNKNH